MDATDSIDSKDATDATDAIDATREVIMSKKRYHVIVSGIVQGVGFRYSAIEKAQNLGVNGWVKNRTDGKVESVVEGEADAAKQMMSWLKQGPPSATVTDVEVQHGQYKGEFGSFGLG
jgi:acylphosphatase